jgi:hypothetical protein
MTGQICHSLRQGLGFIKTRNLDNEFHKMILAQLVVRGKLTKSGEKWVSEK